MVLVCLNIALIYCHVPFKVSYNILHINPSTVAPEIEVAPANTVVISPNVVMFYCEAIGVLTPNISWQMNGNYLKSRGDVEISIDTRDSRRNSTLYVRNTVPNDAGNYTCVAATAAGNVSASAVLTVNCTFQPLTVWVDVSFFLSLSCSCS